MSAPAGFRVILKKGHQVRPRAKRAGGFDYPTKLVGVTKWVGTDGKPVTVYYDPSTGTQGLTVAQYVLSKLEDVMASCDVWFGVKGLSGNVIVAPDFGGAYHYGCDFTNGGDWYLSLSDKDTVVGLAMAEITESYMGLQGRGWNCGGSGGEALSRVLAEIATGGAGGAMVDYTSASSWDGSNWIDKDQGTDQDYPSIGCGVLYLWWMISRGYGVAEITQAGESGGTLAGNYRTLGAGASAWSDFQKAVSLVGQPASFTTDNPFAAANPPYPANQPAPPTPPTPPGGTTFIPITGTLDFFGQTLAFTGQADPTNALSNNPHRVNWPAFVAASAKLAADLFARNWVAVAADMAAVIAALGESSPNDHLADIAAHIETHIETEPLAQHGPPAPK